jgi:hypothetical protein
MLKSFPARLRTGKRKAGMSGALVMSLFPNSYSQPKLNRSPLLSKLIILKRRKLKFLNLLDKFVLFGL